MTAEDKPKVERLDVDNYATWSIRMRALLTTKGLWGAVTGDNIDPEKDQKALAQIILHVKDHHLVMLGSCASAQVAWNTLKTTYEAKTNARKLLLRRELTQLKMGATEPLTMYAARATEIQAQLTTAGDNIPDQELAIQFLAGLPSAYAMITTVLISSDGALSIANMLPKLLQVEQMTTKQERPSEAALYARPRGGKSPGSQSSSKQQQLQQDDRTCFYCGRKGHWMHECKKKMSDEERGRNSEIGRAHV